MRRQLYFRKEEIDHPCQHHLISFSSSLFPLANYRNKWSKMNDNKRKKIKNKNKHKKLASNETKKQT